MLSLASLCKPQRNFLAVKTRPTDHSCGLMKNGWTPESAQDWKARRKRLSHKSPTFQLQKAFPEPMARLHCEMFLSAHRVFNTHYIHDIKLSKHVPATTEKGIIWFTGLYIPGDCVEFAKRLSKRHVFCCHWGKRESPTGNFI